MSGSNTDQTKTVAGSEGISAVVGEASPQATQCLDSSQGESLQQSKGNPGGSFSQCESIVSTTPDPISLIDKDYVYLMVNGAFLQAQDKLQDEVVGHTVEQIWGKELFENTIKGFLDRCIQGEVVNYSGAFPFGALGVRFMSVTYYPYVDTDGSFLGAVVSSRDITDFKTATDALLESEKQYHELFEANADALLVFDFDGTLLDVNLAACAIYGLAKEEFIGNSVLRMIQSEHHHILPTASEVLKSGNTFTTESKGIRNNVEPFPIEVRFSPVRYHGRMVVLAAVSDITERKQAQEKIAYFAHYDQITDLPNRAYFYELLNSSMARVKRRDQWLGLLYVDLDDFKPINDTYGHHTGDILLKLVAGRLISSLREVDVAARIGGDEFALILEELSGVSDANAVAVKVAEAIRQPYSIDGIEVSISASIGIAMYPSDGSDADVLLNCADKAMYRAKTAAKGL